MEVHIHANSQTIWGSIQADTDSPQVDRGAFMDFTGSIFIFTIPPINQVHSILPTMERKLMVLYTAQFGVTSFQLFV